MTLKPLTALILTGPAVRTEDSGWTLTCGDTIVIQDTVSHSTAETWTLVTLVSSEGVRTGAGEKVIIVTKHTGSIVHTSLVALLTSVTRESSET